MIDRGLVSKIAAAAIEAYQECGLIDIEVAKTEAVLATVDEFTPDEPTDDEIEAEIELINMEYLALPQKQPVPAYMREGWARERIARRKEREANSR